MKKNLIFLITSAFLFSCSGNNSENKQNNADIETKEAGTSDILVFSTDPNVEVNKDEDLNEEFTSNTICDEDYEHKEDGDVYCITKIDFKSDKYPDFEATGSIPGITFLDLNQDGEKELLHAYSPRGAWTSYTLYRLSNSSDKKEWKAILSFTEYASHMEEDSEKSYIYWLPKERKVKLVTANVLFDDLEESFFDWDID